MLVEDLCKLRSMANDNTAVIEKPADNALEK